MKIRDLELKKGWVQIVRTLEIETEDSGIALNRKYRTVDA